MTLDDLYFFRSWFENYTKRFPSFEANVAANLRYKKEHSQRVRDFMLTLGDDLQLTEHDSFLAETIGLFHDVGRFEQYTKYHTFKDYLSEDHAKLGVAVLKREQDLLGRLHESEKKLMFTAILNHNQRVIDENVDEDNLVFCQLIRDADKLDILNQIVNFYESPWQFPDFAVESNHQDQRYSVEIIQGILSGKQISYTSVKTPVDIKLVRMAWLLDLTFVKSLEIAKSKRFLHRLWAFIPKTEETWCVFEFIEQSLRCRQINKTISIRNSD